MRLRPRPLDAMMAYLYCARVPRSHRVHSARRKAAAARRQSVVVQFIADGGTFARRSPYVAG